MQHLKRWLLTCHMPEAEVKEVADELGIDAGRISKWRQQHSLLEKSPVGLTDEQKESRRLQKELKEALLARDMDPMLTHVCGFKRRSASFPRETGDIRGLYSRAPESISR
jgi:transposase-like protein